MDNLNAIEPNTWECDDEEKYCLTEWGCLYGVLLDYGIDVSGIHGRVGKHIVEDFMDAMCKAGYIREKEPNEDCKHE